MLNINDLITRIATATDTDELAVTAWINADEDWDTEAIEMEMCAALDTDDSAAYALHQKGIITAEEAKFLNA